MPFIINSDLLLQSRTDLFRRDRLYWIVGGAGSGKTTICEALSTKFDIPVYDMDAHIYSGPTSFWRRLHLPFPGASPRRVSRGLRSSASSRYHAGG